MPVKCVKCNKTAEYIYNGQSLCETHLEEEMKEKIVVVKDRVTEVLSQFKTRSAEMY